MTALTEDNQVDEKEGKLVSMPVSADVVIYKGALLKISDGYVEPCAAEVGANFAGVAYEAVDNTDGGDGDVSVRVIREGIFKLTSSGLAQTDLDDLVYASDDQTVSTTQASNEQEIGKIAEFVSATEIYVDIGSRYRTNK